MTGIIITDARVMNAQIGTRNPSAVMTNARKTGTAARETLANPLTRNLLVTEMNAKNGTTAKETNVVVPMTLMSLPSTLVLPLTRVFLALLVLSWPSCSKH